MEKGRGGEWKGKIEKEMGGRETEVESEEGGRKEKRGRKTEGRDRQR